MRSVIAACLYEYSMNFSFFSLPFLFRMEISGCESFRHGWDRHARGFVGWDRWSIRVYTRILRIFRLSCISFYSSWKFLVTDCSVVAEIGTKEDSWVEIDDRYRAIDVFYEFFIFPIFLSILCGNFWLRVYSVVVEIGTKEDLLIEIDDRKRLLITKNPYNSRHSRKGSMLSTRPFCFVFSFTHSRNRKTKWKRERWLACSPGTSSTLVGRKSAET